MANRRVFISFLGTNNYVQTHYELNGEKSKPVRFIQEALIDFLCKDWQQEDTILIFCTELSKIKNWENNGQERAKTDLEKQGLKGILEKKQLLPTVKMNIIPEGFSEEEVWQIFDTVYENLNNEIDGIKDEIYFDVTHAFRSIPMFSTVLFNYASFLKGIKLKSVHYGAFEKLGPSFEVEKMPLEERVAPILNLTNLVELQNVTKFANNFVNYGRIKNIKDILNTFGNNQRIRNVAENIEKLDGYIQANRMTDIKKGLCIRDIRTNLKSLYDSKDIPDCYKKLLQSIENKLSKFVGEESNENIKAAIDWAINYDMLPQAYTMGQEYIVSIVVNVLSNKKPDAMDDKDFRMYINSLLAINEKDASEKKFLDKIKKYEELSVEILAIDWIIALRKEFKKFADNRNIINHAKGIAKIDDLKSQFKNAYDNSLTIINQYLCPSTNQP